MAALTALVALLAWRILLPERLPFEDAAMLMRYAGHVADGHGMVWNIGGPPIDGATDFLLVVVLALLVKTGLSLEMSVTVIGVVSHLFTVLLVYASARWTVRVNWQVAATAALCVAVGPGLDYVGLFFGTPFFALTVAIAWSLALVLATRERISGGVATAFALAGLVMGLTRPEGVFLAGLMVATLLLYKPQSMRPVLIAYVAVFASLGLGYLVWRRWYFGHFLPTPFTKKGGGGLHFDGLQAAARNVWRMGWPFWLVFVTGLRSRTALRKTWFGLMPLLGFTLLWILMSDEMNHLMRFQYAALPLLHLSWPLVIQGLDRESHLLQWIGSRMVWRAFATASIGAALAFHLIEERGRYESDAQRRSYRDINFEIAALLKPYGAGSYTMATTEAGLLPLYSGWRALDCWGLNDPWIAQHGGVTAEYLAAWHPELIVFHAVTAREVPPHFTPEPMFGLGRAWGEMVVTMHEYALGHFYVLAASFPDPGWGGAYYFYVRPDVGGSAELIARLRDLRRARFR